jgi:hypothetical protein
LAWTRSLFTSELAAPVVLYCVVSEYCTILILYPEPGGAREAVATVEDYCALALSKSRATYLLTRVALDFCFSLGLTSTVSTQMGCPLVVSVQSTYNLV